MEGTYSVLEATMKLMNQEYRSLRHAVSDADAGTMAGVERPFPVDYESVDAPNSSAQFLGFKQSNTPSNVSGANWITYTKEPFEATVPRYDSIRPTKTIQPPVAYLIPQEWTEVISRLKLHGVNLDRLKTAIEMTHQ